MRKCWLILALVVLLGAGLSFAPSGGADQVDFPLIYIDDDVGDGGVGSQADPYNELSDVNWTTGGDNSIFDYLAGSPSQSPRVLCQAGDDWAEILTVGCSGIATYQIIIGKYGSGADPIIDGGNARNYGITATSMDYITVQDLEIKDVLLIGIDATICDNWIIQNCNIYNYGDGANNAVGISFHGATGSADNCDSILIDNNTIGAAECSVNGSVDRAGIRLHGVDNSRIKNNTITTGQVTSGTQGIIIYLSYAGNLSTDNIIENNNITGCELAGIQTRDSDGTIIRYNQIHNHLGVGIGSSYNATGTQCYYNLVYDIQGTSTQGNHFNGIDINQTSVNGFYYNNIVYDVDNACFTVETNADGNTIKNNILDASLNSNAVDHCVYVDASITTVTFGNNDYWDSGDADIGCWKGLGAGDHKTFAEWIALTLETGSLNVAHLMTDPANDDFTPQSSSPCIDMGTDVGLAEDYAGNPIGHIFKAIVLEVIKPIILGVINRPDIGAYEYQY